MRRPQVRDGLLFLPSFVLRRATLPVEGDGMLVRVFARVVFSLVLRPLDCRTGIADRSGIHLAGTALSSSELEKVGRLPVRMTSASRTRFRSCSWVC